MWVVFVVNVLCWKIIDKIGLVNMFKLVVVGMFSKYIICIV